jgi:hypothetical protein
MSQPCVGFESRWTIAHNEHGRCPTPWLVVFRWKLLEWRRVSRFRQDSGYQTDGVVVIGQAEMAIANGQGARVPT